MCWRHPAVAVVHDCLFSSLDLALGGEGGGARLLGELWPPPSLGWTSNDVMRPCR